VGLCRRRHSRPPHRRNREARSRYVSAEHPPASPIVGVSALVGPDWLIEIEAVAVINQPS